MYVRNHCSFAISVHERTEWQYESWTNDSGIIAPQGVFLITSMSPGKIAHLQVVDSEGKLLSRVTVNAAAVNAAYRNHDEIFVEVMPGQSRVNLGEPDFPNTSNSWRTFGIVTAVLVALLIAFRFWQQRM